MDAVAVKQRINVWNLVKKIFSDYGPLVVLIALIVVFQILRPKFFLSPKNILNIFQQVSLFGLVALGITFPLAMKNFDLSVGYAASLAGILVVKFFQLGLNIPLAFALTLILVGGLCGLLNGGITAFLRVPSLIATIGSGFLFFGTTVLITGGTRLTTGIPPQFNVYGVLPFSIIILASLAGVSYVVLQRMGIGRLMYAIGNNEVTCVNAGVSVKGLKLLGFVISSVFAALAGTMLASQVMMGDPIGANRYLMQGLAAAYLGTGIFRKGEANVLGTIVGILIIGVAYNGMTIISVSYSLREAITGLILITGLLFSRNAQ